MATVFALGAVIPQHETMTMGDYRFGHILRIFDVDDDLIPRRAVLLPRDRQRRLGKNGRAGRILNIRMPQRPVIDPYHVVANLDAITRQGRHAFDIVQSAVVRIDKNDDIPPF